MRHFAFFLLSFWSAMPGWAAPRLDAGVIADAPFSDVVAAVASGDRVFVAGESGGRAGLAVYRRAADGTLAFLAARHRDQLGIDLIAAMAVSPDQEFLYLLGSQPGNSRILTFSVAGNGAPILVGITNANGLGAFPRHLAISPDGRTLYASSRLGVAGFARAGDGSLQPVDFLNDGAYDRLLISPGGEALYATGDLTALRSFHRDTATGRLTAAESHTDFSALGLEVREARDLAQSPDGRFLYLLASDFFSHQPTPANDAVIILEHLGNAQLSPRSRGPGSVHPTRAERIAVNPRNGALYLATGDAENGTTRLASFPARDGGRDFYGLSSSVSAAVHRRPLALAVSVDGDHAYLGSFDHLTVEAFSTAGSPGRLDRVAAPGQVSALGLGGMLDFAIAPESGRVLVSASSGGLGLIDAHEGQARFRSLARLGNQPPLERIAFLDETHFAALDTLADFYTAPRLQLYELAENGAITPRGQVFEIGGGEDLWVSPDGRHLYLTGSKGGIHRFEYRAASPALIAHGPVAESFGGGRVRFSADGRSVLAVAEFGSDRTSFFRFDPASGQLTAEPEDSELAADALDFAFSPDGAELYALKLDPSDPKLRIEVRRRGADGAWNVRIQQLVLGDADVYFWLQPQMTLDATGRRMAVLDPTGQTLYHLARDPASGSLTLAEARAYAVVHPGYSEPYFPQRLSYGPGGNDFWLLDPRSGRLEASRWGCNGNLRGELCLGEGGRFRVEADWSTAEARGAGERVEAPSADSGLFYFFDENNWEMMVKVLDGCSINGHFWFFAAATTDVGYTLRVTDTLSSRASVYRNSLGTASLAITDIEALASCPEAPALTGPLPVEASVALAGDPELMVLRNRFELKADWRTATAEGAARVAPFGAADSGIFYFFSENNWEMLAKVLDGCAINGHYWVLAAASTDVGFTLEVKDRAAGGSRTYSHPGGFAAPAILDLQALACAASGAGL